MMLALLYGQLSVQRKHDAASVLNSPFVLLASGQLE
jgi:hypothetical protein